MISTTHERQINTDERPEIVGCGWLKYRLSLSTTTH